MIIVNTDPQAKSRLLRKTRNDRKFIASKISDHAKLHVNNARHLNQGKSYQKQKAHNKQSTTFRSLVEGRKWSRF